MKTRKQYIPTLNYWHSMFLNPSFGGRWTIENRIPVSEIKIDKSLFSFQNEVSEGQVDSMVEEFNIEYWIPITVNPEYFLLDGQHRLQTVKRLGLKYIDVIVDHGDVETTGSKRSCYG
ncbi:MAG: ParB/RepB/Spo0J family partition protein [Anaerolineales bacterium]|nr:hypothetical protein [Anaerolineae bacterium]MBL1173406.1 hypothetical protein [Chloroflexota bacterium]MCL4822950.1 ParB/RepB/Spo0J family partition protein [Anaerolineales bacterium]NOG76914.1 ParB N-terminal domain-containing protein [Chloroflexota bacterium]GIK09979.1 MAG: hypothetical protein BroJett001_20450 [Chloroflexota bacterium]